MNSFEHTEHDRLISDIICLGLVEEIDHQAKQLKVRSKTLSGWLPWPVEIGRNFKRWRPLRKGTQVILGSPSGDMAQAVVIGMLYTSALDAPADDPDVDVISFENGAAISHNAATGDMNITCKGDFILDVSGVFVQKALAHVVEGPVEQTGGDMTTDGLSIQNHTHPESIGVVTGGPE